ncbi:MAG: nucleotide exchange factor GrpE [Oligoflexia bacterium]|nr:nucleotide exchange factor GrpE [Oligoflexia bacterium]
MKKTNPFERIARFFSRISEFFRMPDSFHTVGAELLENQEKSYKQLRKSLLLQEDFYRLLLKVEQKVDIGHQLCEDLKKESCTQKDQGIEVQLIKVIDCLQLFIDRYGGIGTQLSDLVLLRRALDMLLVTAKVKPIAQMGTTYDNHLMIVEGAVAFSADRPAAKGEIVEIISQGYQKENGQLIRKAKVIVSVGEMTV